MKRTRRASAHAIAWLAFLVTAATAAAADPTAVDLDLYAQLLERHTRSVDDVAGTRVDYAALRAAPELRAAVEKLGPDPSLAWFDYDWSLNGIGRPPR